MLRSIWAVVAGVLFVVIVTTVVDVCFHLAGVYAPPPAPLSDALAALATAYRIPIGIAGGFLTAWLAPAEPLKHALILGVVGTCLGVAGYWYTRDLGLGPSWYAPLLALLALPQCWLGGQWFVARKA